MRALSLIVLFALASGWVGCESEAPERRQELMDLVSAENWEEIQARVKLYRTDGETSAPLDFAQGLALLHENADKMAISLLERAVAADSSLAVPASEHFAELARQDLAEGWENRAQRRMAQAYIFDPSVELGDLADRVGDYFFRTVEDYQRAYPIYYELYKDRNGRTEKVRQWVYRYGACLEHLGSLDAARAIYEEYQATWPDDRKYMRIVNWRYMQMLIDLAEEAEELGQYDRALQLLEASMVEDWHLDVQQVARYRSGVIEQKRGHLEEARRWYEMVLEDGSRFGGDLVDQARDRLDELRQMGVH